MPRGRPSKDPRLAWRKARPEKHQAAGWVIRDGRYEASTGCRLENTVGAERALESYLATKDIDAIAKSGDRHPTTIPVAGVPVLEIMRRLDRDFGEFRIGLERELRELKRDLILTENRITNSQQEILRLLTEVPRDRTRLL
jgi:hypothetical protein